MSYYYTWRGAPMGPISIEELIDLAETEALPRETSVWQEGQPAWVRLPAAMQTLGRPLPAVPELPPPDPPEGLAIHDFEATPMRRPPPRTISWPPPDHAEPPPSPVTWQGAPAGPSATPSPATPAPAPTPRRARIPVPAKKVIMPEPVVAAPTPAPAPEPEPPPKIFAPRPILGNKPRKTATLRPPRARSLEHYGEEAHPAEDPIETDLAPWAQEVAERASYTSSLTNTEEEEINTFAGPALNFGDIEPIIDRWNTPSGLRLAAPPPIPRSRQEILDASLPMPMRLPDPVVEEKEQEMAICALSGESWPRSLMVTYKGKLVAPPHLQRLKDGEGDYMMSAASPVKQWVRLLLALLLIVVLVWIFWPSLHPSKNKPAKVREQDTSVVETKTEADPVLQDARILAARNLTGEPWAAQTPDRWPQLLMAQEATFRGERRMNKGSAFLVRALGGQVAGLTSLNLLRPPAGLNPGINLETFNSQILTWKAWSRETPELAMNFTGRFGGLPTRPIYYPDVVPLLPEPLAPTQKLPVTPLTPYPIAPPLSSRAWLVCTQENMPNARQVILSGVIVEYMEAITDTKFTIMLDQPAYIAGTAGCPVLNPQGYLLGVITTTPDRPDSLGRARQFSGEPNAAYIRILERGYDRPGM